MLIFHFPNINDFVDYKGNFFLSRISLNTFWSNWQIKKQGGEISNFWQNHGLTNLEKWKFCNFLISMFLSSTKAIFLSRMSPNTFLVNLAEKKTRWRNLNFFLDKVWTITLLYEMHAVFQLLNIPFLSRISKWRYFKYLSKIMD